MESVRKHRDIKLVTTEITKNYLVLCKKVFFKKSNSDRNEKKQAQIFINKPVYLGLSI